MISLRPYNSFGVECFAEKLLTINHLSDLLNILPTQEPILVLGEGSNILFTKNWTGLVVLNRIKGIEIIRESNDEVWVKVGAGENWHEFTQWAVDNNLGGVENLSLIYGTVGAAPIQNIGAYGVELETVFERLETVILATGEVKTYEKAACRFGYRESVFKHELKNQHCIVSVTLKLHRNPKKFNTDYGDIALFLQNKGIKTPTLRDISQAVVTIRTQKLPNPSEMGNAGSFFKNPVLSKRQYNELLQQFPYMPSFALNETQVKIPAAWLIQQSGWRGRRVDDAGVAEKHALVLVNYGKATGMEIKHLALDILHDVKQKFGIMLTPEVNIF